MLEAWRKHDDPTLAPILESLPEYHMALYRERFLVRSAVDADG